MALNAIGACVLWLASLGEPISCCLLSLNCDRGIRQFLLIASGLAVGIGTRIGNGCTSGHGVCGIGMLSVRSIAATVAFMISGILTVTILRNFIG